MRFHHNPSRVHVWKCNPHCDGESNPAIVVRGGVLEPHDLTLAALQSAPKTHMHVLLPCGVLVHLRILLARWPAPDVAAQPWTSALLPKAACGNTLAYIPRTRQLGQEDCSGFLGPVIRTSAVVILVRKGMHTLQVGSLGPAQGKWQLPLQIPGAPGQADSVC